MLTSIVSTTRSKLTSARLTFITFNRFFCEASQIEHQQQQKQQKKDAEDVDENASIIPPPRIYVPNKHKHFMDSLRIHVQGGAGGNGFPRFGGIGGKGGDVYVEGTDFEDVTLKYIQYKWPSKRFKGGMGENSKTSRVLGQSGGDFVLKCPVGLTVIGETGRVLGEINKAGDKVMVAIGGRGGDKVTQYMGQKGQSQSITLDLKLIADAGMVGFPNAGKSMLLKAISRASPKIANYPFTTLHPNIGIMEYKDYRQISVADLPGLIEGAHMNYGLGHKFLKHIVRTKLLLFVVDVDGFQYRPDWPKRTAFDSLMLLNKELELYDDRLIGKPSMLIITKMDSRDADKKYDKFLQQLKEAASGNFETIENEMRPNQLINFDDIIPVCAKTAFNIPDLRDRIRELIDVNFDIERRKDSSFRSIAKQSEANIRKADDVYLV